MTELEDKFGRLLEEMKLTISLRDRGLISEEEEHTRLFILSREVEILALEVTGKEARGYEQTNKSK